MTLAIGSPSLHRPTVSVVDLMPVIGVKMRSVI